VKLLKLDTRITQNIPVVYHSRREDVRTRNVPQPNKDLEINVYKTPTNMGNKRNKRRNKNEFLFKEKRKI
jgi:hypothetical protein